MHLLLQLLLVIPSAGAARLSICYLYAIEALRDEEDGSATIQSQRGTTDGDSISVQAEAS